MHPIAIVCADIHLSLHPPIARAGEKDWFMAMARPLRQLKEIQDGYNVPILCAGDIFDHWRSVPELINFALEELPPMIAIPGQHDMPYHDANLLKKSAFWTLVKAGKILFWDEIMGKGYKLINGSHMVSGFAYGEKIESQDAPEPGKLHIALVHQYVWKDGCSYPGAPKEAHVKNLSVKKFDVVVFGDNHKPFNTSIGQTQIINCGCLFRRKSDEIKYIPRVCLIISDGSVETIPLDTSKDVIEKTGDDLTTVQIELKDFLDELGTLAEGDFDFPTAVRRALEAKKLSSEAEKMVMEAIEAR